MAAIVCDGLVKEDHTQRTVRALAGIDLVVEDGEIFGLLGPNGAGKTTLVRILATLLRATSGRATVGGYDVDAQEAEIRRIIGYAGQDSERSAYFRLTVEENLLYFAHALRGVPRSVARERIQELAAGVGFETLLGSHFSALSGGQKQLVVVMRALLHRPRIAFMDEPSKSLDPVTAQRGERLEGLVRGQSLRHPLRRQRLGQQHGAGVQAGVALVDVDRHGRVVHPRETGAEDGAVERRRGREQPLDGDLLRPPLRQVGVQPGRRVEAHDARATVSKDGMDVAGDSIMGLLMLAASRGTSIEVKTSGAEAEKLADALEALVAARFGEDY